jgi:plastocyanin
LAAAAVVVAIPAFAYGQPERAPGSIVAVDYSFENPADGTPLVTINPGETVTFSYPAGANFHNVRFTQVQPTSCTLTTGGAGSVPPLPANPSAPGWSGTCTFSAEGTYEFVCALHGDMLGAVLVVPVGATPTPTPSTTATPTRTPTPTPTATQTSTPAATATAAPQSTIAPTPTAPPAARTTGPAAARLKLARTQHGQAVKGSLTVTQAGSRLRVEVLVKRKRVGTATRSVNAGNAAFTVKLDAGAKRTLQRSRKLALTVRITVTPPAGPAFIETRKVTLRR